MAKLVLTNAQVLINAVDLSDHVKTVTINYTAAELDATTMGASSIARLPGLKDWTMDVTFTQDYGSSSVDATLFPLVGTASVVDVKPVNGARSATNPSYTGTGILSSYQPMGQSVGQVNDAVVKISGSNGTALQRLIV